jgi:hypothetical protein
MGRSTTLATLAVIKNRFDTLDCVLVYVRFYLSWAIDATKIVQTICLPRI